MILGVMILYCVRDDLGRLIRLVCPIAGIPHKPCCTECKELEAGSELGRGVLEQKYDSEVRSTLPHTDNCLA